MYSRYYSDTETSDVFIVVMKGLNIGFFEYNVDYEYHETIALDNIPNFENAIPLTQPYMNHGPVLSDIPADVKLLYHDTERLRNITETRQQASALRTPCVFNIEKHHMANNTTRC